MPNMNAAALDFAGLAILNPDRTGLEPRDLGLHPGLEPLDPEFVHVDPRLSAWLKTTSFGH